MDWTLKGSDVAIVFATLLGPILAVQAQGWLDSRREERRRRLNVFHTLMRTRMNPIAVEHVNALNAVPLEFQGSSKDVKAVMTSWRIYINHFNKQPETPGWGDRRLELLSSLLQCMGGLLKYDLDTVQIEREAYSPIAHAQAAADQDLVRQGLAAIFRGEKTFPMSVERMPTDPEMREGMVNVLNKLDKFLEAHLAENRD
ncbi:DUF6680 family protein [Aquitalea sp. ASV15]|uniref:DUF6680 family protein n=1 Tax=Aquitalea sp. ASV15 TaxID=2795104 RepID=UPI0018EB16F1|nr:DUF6680 family protein [Aquitalea sp. ASV15]